MRVITTHLSADFDAFAAALCAVRLYPGYKILFPGSLEAAVRRFRSEIGIPFPEIRLRQARRSTWEHAVVVDTRTPRRLGEAWDMVKRWGCPVTLIDHHVWESEGLGATENFSKPVGATCTIIAELMQEQQVRPSPEEASLLLMGIYEDTGGLSFNETKPEDHRAAAWLLEQGGSLEWVRTWVLKGLHPEHFELLNQIVEQTEEILIHGVEVSISLVEVDTYHEEAAYVVHSWVDTFDIAVGIVILVRPPHVNLIMRSNLPGLHLGRVAQRFGGGGHATAAAARISHRMPVEIREELLHYLDEEMPPPAQASDVAENLIFSISSSATVAAAKERINQLRVNALPVRETSTGALVGVVTRRILDQAIGHDLDQRPVSSIMQPEVPVVGGNTSLERLRDLFLERSYRFVVVEQEGRPPGIITRMELFRRLFERQHEAGARLDHRMAGSRPVTQLITRSLKSVAPAWAQKLIEQIREVADTEEVPVYLVGGVVRDLLLERPNEDLDLVVEGEGIAFAQALASKVNGRCHIHQPFLSAVLVLPDGHKVDVVSARTEFYRTPAALPEVETSLIRQDLYRRDFTINALALTLSGNRYGQLLDFFGGRKDLHRREIRVLHSLSFIDDPTRAIRAIRYARRLGFTIARDTRHLISTAVKEGAFAGLTGRRLVRELKMLLAEPHPPQSLAMLEEHDLLAAVSPELVWNEQVNALLQEVEGQVTWYEVEHLGDLPEPLSLYLGALLLFAGAGAAVYVAQRLQLTGHLEQQLIGLADAVKEVSQAAAEDLSRSRRVRTIEAHTKETLLLAMAGLDVVGRRRLAEATAAARRVCLPIRGRDLLQAGVAPGPMIGEALRRTRDALVDGSLDPSQALEHALAIADMKGECAG
jgi:tRNA nucleotidyltransferase (CCA-adding enzyme)